MLSSIALAAETGEANRIAQFFKTPENLQIISSPERVDICILYPDLAPGEKFSQKVKEGLYKQVSTEAAAVLSTKLTDGKTYRWNDSKMCIPAYNARIRFHRGSSSVCADFCFGCEIVNFSRDGTQINDEDFDPIRAEVLEIVRSNFPDDKVVLAIIAEEKRLEEWKRTHAKLKKPKKEKRSDTQ